MTAFFNGDPHAAQVVQAQSLTSGATNSDTLDGCLTADELTLVVQGDNTAGTSPTLDGKLQTSYDGGTTWLDIGASGSGAITQLTADGNQVKYVPRGSTNFWGDLVRAVLTVGGTASPAWTVTCVIQAR